MKHISSILSKMFPYPDVSYGRGGMEVNGLPTNALPYGRVVLMFTPDNERDRTFYLMETTEGVFVLLRVCKINPEGTFAVIHEIAHTPETIFKIKETAQRWAIRI